MNRSLHRTRRAGLAAGSLLAALVLAGPSTAEPQVLPPDGFRASLFAVADGLPTALTIGPDDRIYATVISPDFSSGWVIAWEDNGGIACPGQRVATGLDLPLGLAFGPDGTLYVSENASLDGPNARGRVTALTDTDSDGVRDDHQTVIRNIPNGRHQTNGLTFGADGWLYIANGNATDDGLECGPVGSTECNNQEFKPWTGAILKADPTWQDVDLLAGGLAVDQVLVAEGFRNIYGLAFRPGTSSLYTIMNGSDDPSSSEPIYRTDVADGVIDNMWFPSCLYDPHDNRFPEPQIGGHEHPGDLTPRNNPNIAVRDAFGVCPVNEPPGSARYVTRPLGFVSPHAGVTGLKFVPPGNFPESYVGDLIYTEWGSIWNLNSGQVTGHKVFHHEINADGTLGPRQELMTLPLPMDVAFDDAGVLFIADQTGGIYRVEFQGDGL